MERNSILENRRKLVKSEVREAVSFSFEIVDRIHHILESKGLKQKDLAALLNKNEAEISKWMRGTHNFTIMTIKSIEKVLGAKIIDISSESEDCPINPILIVCPIPIDSQLTFSTTDNKSKYSKQVCFNKLDE